ncbi:hypothetical protein C8R44DRAFT_787755 [Mycena epipterygia]|nr:hypothetical protein C8R44DRAFT_787755 [Mycena epipterygia]
MQRNVVYALAGISAGSEHGARAVVNAHVLDHFAQLVQSSNPDVVRLACWLLANIARHASLNPAVVELHPLIQLVSLMQNAGLSVRQEAGHALRCIIIGGEQQQPGSTCTDGEAGHRGPRIFGAILESAGFWSRASYVPRPWAKTLGSINSTTAFRL